MGFTAELAVEAWHFLQGLLSDMINASPTPAGWAREELQEFLDGSIQDGDTPPISAIPSDSMILRPCDLPYNNKTDQYSQMRRIVNKPLIPLMPLDLSIRYNDDAPGIPKSRSKAESIAPDEMRHCARINRAALRAGTEQSAQNASRPSPTAPGHHVSAVASSSAHPSSSLSSESASSELSNGSDDSPDFSTMFPAIINNIDNDYNLDFAPSTFWPQHEDHSLHTSIHAPITFGTTNESVHASISAPDSTADEEVEMGSAEVGDGVMA
ncbi:hypothetical protein C8J57DRAFT_1292558 [Mycena rebaudengoi]|nr:hypothetical protein C8J57DRAFT_1292558 [Mycena rebaudengoi]